ncbi:MAG: hypothetical protein ACXAEF_07025 [Candidatus Thorarchaeota archaeon]|jgi:hypothetical protein
MIDMKERLVHLVNEEDLSAVQLLAGEIGIAEDDTRNLLEEILREGLIDGYLTEDGKRIFKNSVELSDKPSIKSEEKLPEFLSYNTTPGRIVAFIGIIICIVGGILLATSGGIIYYENLGTILLLAGAIITMLGAYWIGRLKTP